VLHPHMDPAEFASALSGTNADMLLHTTRAQVHVIILKQKGPFFKESFLRYPMVRACTNLSASIFIIANQ